MFRNAGRRPPPAFGTARLGIGRAAAAAAPSYPRQTRSSRPPDADNGPTRIAKGRDRFMLTS